MLGPLSSISSPATDTGAIEAAMIIEGIGAEVSDDTSFALAWAGTFGTLDDLAERVGPRFLPYLRDSIRQTSSGWRLAFDPWT